MKRAVPFWVIPVFIGMAVGTVWLRLSVVKTSYEINQVDRTIRSLQLDREQIELRVSGLRSPRRLEILARSKYSLSQPNPSQVVYMAR